MFCYTYANKKLIPGIEPSSFYSPLFTENIKEASIRLVTGGCWDLSLLAEAIKRHEPHAFLCCLVELIPPTGNTSSLFPADTCLLDIPTECLEPSPADNSVLFATEGKHRLYGCIPNKTFLRVGKQQIVHKKGKLHLESAPPLREQIADPYQQYRGQDINVLELL